MPIDLELLFSWAGNLAMLGWVVLAFLPWRGRLIYMLTGVVIPCLLAVLYGGLMFANFASATGDNGGGGYGSLAEVKALFGKDELLLAGWVHYLAFDLAIGAWIAERADRAGISRIIQIPILFMTLMFGPVGYLLFVLTETGWNGARRLSGRAS